ncbi:hypothetical protein KC19_7G187800 [Ceratodon purpureus]|uniref:Uncharacterized protein n=1 Tax=Ceratodon purpureus TaxID=3225 RepID=A0A8T0H859_CERPU|nr:hypothetical protein KC19_7G187800 [Ceratodon purpureus]
MTCPKHVPLYGSFKPSTSQLTTEDKALAKVIRFVPSSFTYAITLSSKLNSLSRGSTIVASAAPVVLCARNTPTVTWRGTQSVSRKLTTMQKVS